VRNPTEFDHERNRSLAKRSFLAGLPKKTPKKI